MFQTINYGGFEFIPIAVIFYALLAIMLINAFFGDLLFDKSKKRQNI